MQFGGVLLEVFQPFERTQIRKITRSQTTPTQKHTYTNTHHKLEYLVRL